MLRLIDATRYPAALDDWPLPLEVPFIDSRELDWLQADMDRYVRGRVRGRSYLIAGHRGVGKTALVQRAVALVAAATMRESVKENGELGEGPFQRPLLVKLHGPSMLDDAVPAPAPAVPATPEDAGGKVAAEEKPATPAPDGAQGAAVAPGPHAALVQITIGLYRALAAEAATGFRAHARLAVRARPSDQAELATQLALDLDGGVAPGRLRFYWGALGRLRPGILWPRRADDSLDTHGMEDQGLREVVALATAAQAFQVCTGRIAYSETTKDHLVRTEIAELKGESNLRDALARLGTLGLGAVTGVSLFGIAGRAGATPALVGGLAVWLLGSLSLTWSRSRTRTDDRSVDYSFIRDSTLATLGRDLPVVITRVRDAGLAPVFVIDELDKVSDAPAALTALVAKLKHLIADFGFFCFLVNRDCYEEIEARLRASAYPPEHTLFSDRLLLRPEPAYMMRYLAELVSFDAVEPQAGLARVVFALVAIHEARLNLTDLMRSLTRAVRHGTRDLGDAASLTVQRRLVVATVQIAIDETLRSPRLRERMEASPSFAQLAVDTLYYPSRLWDDGQRYIDPSADALQAHLGHRRHAKTGQPDAPGRPEPAISADDMDLLQSHLMDLLDSLGNIDGLRAALGDRNALGAAGEPQAGDARLADVPPRDVARICEPCQDGLFLFLYSRDGDPVVATPGRLDPARRDEAEQSLAFSGAFQKVLAAVGVDIDELARTPLIASVGGGSLEAARKAVTVALRRGSHDPDVEQHLSTLKRLQQEVCQNAEKIGQLLLIVASLARDTDQPTALLPAISRLLRFEHDPKDWIRGLEDRPIRPLPKESAELEQWAATYKQALLPAPGDVGLNKPPDFERLSELLRRIFAQPRDRTITPDYPMLIQAVRGELPACALAWDLSTLTAGDWSRLVLAAVPTRARPAAAPYWLFVAGLRGLGFGREALEELSAPDIAEELAAADFLWKLQAEGMTMEECLKIAREFAAGAPDRPAGILVIEHEDDRFGGEAPSSRRPVLIVDSRDQADYRPALNWLLANGILTGQAIGLDDVAEGYP